jgi:hypothetical protein
VDENGFLISGIDVPPRLSREEWMAQYAALEAEEDAAAALRGYG